MDRLPPPPPYTETDTSSHVGIMTPATTSTFPSQSHYAPSPTSTSGSRSPVYTPPYSPSTTSEVPPPASQISTSISASATAYFESRPFHRSTPPLPILSHVITLPEEDRSLEAKEIPFPQPWTEWTLREVCRPDWDTFVNFLLPYRDLKNEGRGEFNSKGEWVEERMGGLSLGENAGRGSLSGDGNDGTGRGSVFASKEEEKEHMDNVIREWNEGFFDPRGAHISIRTARPGEDSERAGMAQRHQEEMSRQTAGYGGWSRYLPRMEANENGFRLGNMVADHTGFRIGNAIVADQHGFRMGGRQGFMAHNRGGFSVFGRGFQGSRDVGGGGFDGAREASGRPGCGSRRDRGSRDDQRHRHHHHHHGGGRSRGRYRNSTSHDRNRSHSRSSSSFSSSSSSSDSDSHSDSSSNDSNDSLISLSKIKDPQLPDMKETLQNWLNHPDHPPITATTISEINHSVKHANSTYAGGIPSKAEIKGLRQEVKGLLRAFKNMQKVDKLQRKAAKREKRASKRAEKTIRRAERREEKKGRREERRAGRRERGGNERGGNHHHHHHYSIPQSARTYRSSHYVSRTTAGIPVPRTSGMRSGQWQPRTMPHEQETGIVGVDDGHNDWEAPENEYEYAGGNEEYHNYDNDEREGRDGDMMVKTSGSKSCGLDSRNGTSGESSARGLRGLVNEPNGDVAAIAGGENQRREDGSSGEKGRTGEVSGAEKC